MANSSTRRMRSASRLIVWVSAIALVGVVLVVGVGVLRFVLQDHSPYDFGPYRGDPVPLPASPATSSVTAGEFTVECHSHSGSPVVITTRRPNGSPVGAWEIVPRGGDGAVAGTIRSCQLVRSRSKEKGHVVHGGVVWSHGSEHATFYIDEGGRLTEFYLSW